jgi:hypothetical protein
MARVHSEFTHILHTNARGFANTAAAYPIKASDVEAATQRADNLNRMNDNASSYVVTWERATTKAKQFAMQQIRNGERLVYAQECSDWYLLMLAEACV